jgi:hypothetical protein
MTEGVPSSFSMFIIICDPDIRPSFGFGQRKARAKQIFTKKEKILSGFCFGWPMIRTSLTVKIKALPRTTKPSLWTGSDFRYIDYDWKDADFNSISCK